MDDDRLKLAVENWIRAEYQFRCGREAYHKITEEWFLKTAEKLRKIVTGQKDLNAAYAEIKDNV